MTAWFASDLHLDPTTPQIADRFKRFLAGPARRARSLFLLGDLFEAWIGDDDPEPAHREVIASLAAAGAAGTKVFVMRGNRDFMIGPRFCAESGATLLEDPSLVTLAGERVLLTHGDGLCTDDRAYQRLRALVNDPGLRDGFARLPIEARRRLATEARAGAGDAGSARGAPYGGRSGLTERLYFKSVTSSSWCCCSWFRPSSMTDATAVTRSPPASSSASIALSTCAR